MTAPNPKQIQPQHHKGWSGVASAGLPDLEKGLMGMFGGAGNMKPGASFQGQQPQQQGGGDTGTNPILKPGTPQPNIMPPVNPTGSLTTQAFQPPAGAQITPVNPADDLRSKQVTPGNDPRLAQTQGQTDQARNAVSSFQGYTPFQGVPTANSPYVNDANALRTSAAASLGTGQVAGTNLDASRSHLASAQRSVAGISPKSISGAAFGGDTAAARARLNPLLDSLNDSPERSALAAQAFQLMREQSDPAFQQNLRQINAKNAAMGRQGSGMAGSNLTDALSERERFLSEAQRGLALDAAGQTLQDRINRVNTTRGVTDSLAGIDLGASGLNQSGQIAGGNLGLSLGNFRRGLANDAFTLDNSVRREGEADRAYGLDRSRAQSALSDQAFGQGFDLRGEERTERNTRRDFETGDLNAKRGVLGDLADLEQTQFSEGVSNRGELRDERAFQDHLSQQGITNARNQRMDEEALVNSAFGRNMTQAGTLGEIGYGYDPTRTLQYGAGAAQDSADAAYGGASDMATAAFSRPPNPMTPTTAGNVIGAPQPNVIPPTVARPGTLQPPPTLFPAPTRPRVGGGVG